MNLGRESETTEFKKSASELKEAVISIVAILNKHRKGELYFGVSPDGTPVGQDVSEKTLRDISRAIMNHIEPRIFPEVEAVAIDGRQCVSVKFEGHNTPYFAYDIAGIRVADEDRAMSQAEIIKYLRQKQGMEDAWEKRVSDTPVSAVPEENVRRYVERSRAAGRIAFEYAGKAAALNKLNLTDGDCLLNRRGLPSQRGDGALLRQRLRRAANGGIRRQGKADLSRYKAGARHSVRACGVGGKVYHQQHPLASRVRRLDAAPGNPGDPD